MKKYLIFLVIAAFVVTITVTGIGCKEPEVIIETVTETVTETVEVEVAAEEEAIGEEGEVVIGLSFPTRNSSFWQKALRFAQQCSDQLGFRLVAIDNDRLEDRQVNDVESLVSMGVDAIVMCPNTTAIAPKLMEMAENAGVPFVFVDRDPGEDFEDWEYYVAFVGQMDEIAGYNMAKALIANGAKNIAAIGGVRGTANADARERGLLKAIEEHKDEGVTLLDYQDCKGERDAAFPIAENLFTAHPDMEAMWLYCDEQAMGAIKAAENAGLVPGEDILFASMDITEEAIEKVKNGELLFTVGGHWVHTGFGPMVAFDYLNGFEPEERKMFIEYTEVSVETVESYIENFIEKEYVFDFTSISKSSDPNNVYDLTLPF